MSDIIFSMSDVVFSTSDIVFLISDIIFRAIHQYMVTPQRAALGAKLENRKILFRFCGFLPKLTLFDNIRIFYTKILLASLDGIIADFHFLCITYENTAFAFRA